MSKNDGLESGGVVTPSGSEGGLGLKLKGIETQNQEGLQACPHCDRMIPEDDRVCMSCGFDLKRGKTVKEQNKPPIISPKVLLSVVVLISLGTAGYIYRQNLAKAVDEQFDTKTSEFIDEHMPKAVSDTEESTSLEGKTKDKTGVTEKLTESAGLVDGAVADLDAEGVVKEVNEFLSMSQEDLEIAIEDLQYEVDDAKINIEDMKQGYKEQLKEGATIQKQYKRAVAKKNKYLAASKNTSLSGSDRRDYKEQARDFNSEANEFKSEYSRLSKEVASAKKELVAPMKELRVNTEKLKQMKEALGQK